ncbi:MAG: PIG-L family deacetylase [Capnocytophaga sp.]|nr:PIG-L family deacetylase [Capnocytophaga sp.]
MRKTLWFVCLLATSLIYGQSHPKSSAELYDDMLRIRNYGSAMYLAAHPDDENTQVISWLAHAKHLDAVYLSLTRGDGGQNLIGTEKGELLGLLRTQELLEARKTDKGRQWFTRAVDFGYSKTTDETLRMWDEQTLLSDVVWAIRKNQPQVIITRFHPDSNGKTHGHHTTSALLAMKAFDMANDPDAFPEQLQYVSLWQPKRMFFNMSWFFYGSQEAFDKVDKTGKFPVDTGIYYPHLGNSNNEIALRARSKHACQGFGAALNRGSQTEWFEWLKGSKPKNNDIFEGIDFQWNIQEINPLMDKLIHDFDFLSPEKSLPLLLEIYDLARKNNANSIKIKEIENLIANIQGFYFEWVTTEEYGVNGQSVATTLELTNRSSNTVNVTVGGGQLLSIAPNESRKIRQPFVINSDVYSVPYWLQSPAVAQFYPQGNPHERGVSENLPLLSQHIALKVNGHTITYDVFLKNKTVNPAVGERYQPFYVVPAVVADFSESSYVFRESEKEIRLNLQSWEDNAQGNVQLISTNNAFLTEKQPFYFRKKGERKAFVFTVNPSFLKEKDTIKAVVTTEKSVFSKSMQVVNYPHIDKQIWIREATVPSVKINIKTLPLRVGYIDGSGDAVLPSLRLIGIDAKRIPNEHYSFEEFRKYDAIVLGIRAFNVNEILPFHTADLWKYVHEGGTVIVQYNTNSDLLTPNIAPTPLKLGRKRIAEEDAPLKIIAPKHKALRFPNIITQTDFENWVQERGLYFAEDWGKEYTPLLEGNDTGERATKGILLVNHYGKGYYVQTGLSFFRELPAGVPGAYRLFVNLLSLSQEE